MNIQEVLSKLNVKFEEGRIYSTTEYGMFHRIPGNRPIFEPHVTELVSKINDENLLLENPIMITNHDGGLGVVSGQHRWKAAEILGVPLYFMYKKDATLKQVRVLGATNRDWFIRDYLESIIEETGNKDYKQLRAFADEYKISLPIALHILADEFKDKKVLLHEFRNGRFAVKNYETADRMAGLLTDVRLHCIDNAWVDRRLMLALRKFLETGSPRRLIRKLQEYDLAISKRKSVREYQRQIENILNFEGASQ